MTEVQMQSIVRDAINLDKEDKIRVMIMVRRHNSKLVNFKADGCRIILNNLPEGVINEIYNFIRHKLQS